MKAMHCPKCGYAIRRFAIMRTERLSCPGCGIGLEPVHMRAPLLMFLLALLPVHLTSLSRAYQFRVSPGAMVWLGIGYAAAWIALIVMWVRESRRPRLRERVRPKPEIVLDLHSTPASTNSR